MNISTIQLTMAAVDLGFCCLRYQICHANCGFLCERNCLIPQFPLKMKPLNDLKMSIKGVFFVNLLYCILCTKGKNTENSRIPSTSTSLKNYCLEAPGADSPPKTSQLFVAQSPMAIRLEKRPNLESKAPKFHVNQHVFHARKLPPCL